MRILYRPHLTRRLKERNIPKEYPKKILQESEQDYVDRATGHHIAVKKLQYSGKLRNMVIAYDIIEKISEIITIYPISESELRNKLKSGRWELNEKN